MSWRTGKALNPKLRSHWQIKTKIYESSFELKPWIQRTRIQREPRTDLFTLYKDLKTSWVWIEDARVVLNSSDNGLLQPLRLSVHNSTYKSAGRANVRLYIFISCPWLVGDWQGASYCGSWDRLLIARHLLLDHLRVTFTLSSRTRTSESVWNIYNTV